MVTGLDSTIEIARQINAATHDLLVEQARLVLRNLEDEVNEALVKDISEWRHSGDVEKRILAHRLDLEVLRQQQCNIQDQVEFLNRQLQLERFINDWRRHVDRYRRDCSGRR